MIAAVFRGPGELDVTEIGTPEVGPGEILVKVGANTVCGTDVRILKGEKTKGILPDVVLGHEFSGHVAEVGKDVAGYEIGAPVAMYPLILCGHCYFCLHDMENMCQNMEIIGNAINGGMAEYMLVSEKMVRSGGLFVSKEDLPSEQLSLAEPLSACLNGLNQYRVEVDDTVLILGAGPIGLFHTQLALLSGAREVIVSNPAGIRQRYAEELGAAVTVDPFEEDLAGVVAERTGGRGADVAVICIGLPSLVNDALRLVRKGGRVNVFAGLAAEGWSEIEANLIHYNQIVVTGGSNARRADFGKAMSLIETGRIDTARMVTHRFPLAEAAEAIDESARGDGIKVAIVP